MKSVWVDVKRAARTAAAAPGQFAAPVLALGLGLAAAVTLYTAFRAVADDVAPVPEPERVARLYAVDRSAPMGRRPFRPAEIQGVIDRAAEQLVVTRSTRRPAPVDINGCVAEARSSTVRWVSPNFSDVIRVAPQLGRALTRDSHGSEALLSAAFWRTACAADTAIIGRPIRVEGDAYDVVGVMPDGFWFGDRDTDVWVRAPQTATGAGVDLFGRLDGPETWVRVSARFAEGPVEQRVVAVPLTDPSVRRGAQAVIGLLGPALLVLLVACGNASAVLVAGALRRERELAIRVSLGAGPWRMAREAVIESALVAVSAGALALPLSFAGVRILRAMIVPLSAGTAASIVLETGAIAFGLATVAVSVALTGLVPAILAARTDLAPILPAARNRTIWRPGAYGVADLLVLIQVALSVVLVVVTLLFHSVIEEVAGTAPHGSLEQIGVVRLVSAAGSAVETSTAARARDAIRDLPGVSTAALSDTRPLPAAPTAIVTTDAADGSDSCHAVVRAVTPEYFSVLGLNVESGFGAIVDRDTAVASATLSRKCWSTGAVGRQVSVKRGPSAYRFEIAGVVSDVGRSGKIASLQAADLYVPALERTLGESAYLVFRRQPGLAPTDVEVRRAVDQASAGALSVDENSTLADIVGRQREGAGTLVALFGALATVSLILVTTGIYASMSQSIARRRRSFAIRLALGASPSSMAWLAIVRDTVLVTAGAGAGVIVTLAITKAVWPEAFLVAGTDWRFWLEASSAIAVVGVSASIGPVWRAIHLDPMSILQRTDS